MGAIRVTARRYSFEVLREEAELPYPRGRLVAGPRDIVEPVAGVEKALRRRPIKKSGVEVRQSEMRGEALGEVVNPGIEVVDPGFDGEVPEA